MKVIVKLFSSLKKYLPPMSDGKICEINVKPGSKIIDVVKQIGIDPVRTKIFFLNGRKISIIEQIELEDGDIISIFPPMAGG